MASSHEDLAAMMLRVLGRLMHQWMHTARGMLRERGLSWAQMMVLRQLLYRGPCTVSEVARHLGVTRAAASQVVDRLVEQGLVAREEDPRDRRQKRITLSQEGRTLMDEATQAHRRWTQDLLASLTPQEREQVRQALQVLEAALERQVLPPHSQDRAP